MCDNKFYVKNSRPRYYTVHTKTCKKRWCHRLGMTWTWKFANYSVFFFRSSSQDRHFLAFAFGRTHIFSWTLSSPGYSWVSFNSIFKLSKCLNSEWCAAHNTSQNFLMIVKFSNKAYKIAPILVERLILWKRGSRFAMNPRTF